MASQAAVRLRRDFVLCPVTALEFFTAESGVVYMLAGQDTDIVIHSLDKSAPSRHLKVFRERVAHGIHVPQDAVHHVSRNIVVWGAHSVSVIPAAHLELLINGDEPPSPHETDASDWIYDAVISPYDSSRGILISGHNEVVPFHVSNEAVPSARLGPAISPSRPMLFSAAATWLTQDKVLIVAGTVFGEVIVWEYEADAGRCHVQNVFKGHEGSIFGVSISPVLDLTENSQMRLIVSCSDDRTVRVWGVLSGEGVQTSIASETLLDGRETGFTNGMSAMIDDQSGIDESPKEVAVVMGHISRIWHVKFVGKRSGADGINSFTICSFGEDANVIEWRLHFDALLWRDNIKNQDDSSRMRESTPLGKLRHVRTLPCHSGKHIWSAAVLHDSEEEPLVATGGADGRIELFKTSLATTMSLHGRHAENRQMVTVTAQEAHMAIDGPDLLDSESRGYETSNILQQHDKKRRGPPIFTNFTFMSRDYLLASTSHGRLLLGDLTGHACWSEVAISNDISSELREFCLIKRIDGETALISMANGHVYVYHHPMRLVKVAELPAKVSDIFSLSDTYSRIASESPASHRGPRVLITMHLQRYPMVVELDRLSQGGGASNCEYLPLDPAVSITSAKMVGDILVVGTRLGDIYLFEEDDSAQIRPGLLQHRVSKEAVSAILPLPSSPGKMTRSFFALYRHGHIRVFDISSDTPDDKKLLLRHDSGSGLYIPNGWFATAGDGSLELVLSGFRSSHFIVWNETRQQEIASIDIGSSRRTYTYLPLLDHPDWLRFAFNKGPALNLYHQASTSHTPFILGTHGREIRAASYNGSLLATCSEDTTIRLWSMPPTGLVNNSNLRCLSVLNRHNAGLQCLRWIGQNILLSSGGNEEMYIWRVTTLNSAYAGLAVECESTFPFRSRDGDLRIISFDADMIDGGRGFAVSIALSDSRLHSYHYSMGLWRPIAVARYTGACPTQIRHLIVEGSCGLELLAAFADGTVSIWRMPHQVGGSNETNDLEMTHAVMPHQSSVKCLDIARVGVTEAHLFAMITGGDDNTISITLLTEKEGGNGYEFCPQGRVFTAHTAAVTGVKIVKADSHEILAVSCSNDQRIKTWKVPLSKSQSKDEYLLGGVQLLVNQNSAVADPGDIVLLQAQKQIMLVGVGVECWSSTVTLDYKD
jgi:WD repeat-containing protein 6